MTPPASTDVRLGPSDAARALLFAAAIALLASCGDGGSGPAVSLRATPQSPESAPAGSALEVRIEVRSPSGDVRPGTAVQLRIERGGGRLDPERPVADASGVARTRWTLGRAPVRNALVASAGRASLRLETRATLEVPYEPERFGDVDGFLAAAGIEGSTEDLSFAPSGALVLGVPGGLIEVSPEGEVRDVPLAGEPIVSPLGIAHESDGSLWVADPGGPALRRVSPDGVVETVLESDGDQPLVGPNYVAIGPRGRVYLSDPCLGELLRYDPASNHVEAVHSFDLATEGGPNGFAFDASGERLFVATENTALLCGQSVVGLVDPVAGLFSLPVTESGFGAREAIATRVALFGDGMAFDAEGNLYVIFDTERDFALEESAIWVLPAGEGALVKLAAVRGRVLANLAFGRGAYGATTLYVSLLAVPPFTPASERGVERLELGIPGQPLLP